MEEINRLGGLEDLWKHLDFMLAVMETESSDWGQESLL